MNSVTYGALITLSQIPVDGYLVVLAHGVLGKRELPYVKTKKGEVRTSGLLNDGKQPGRQAGGQAGGQPAQRQQASRHGTTLAGWRHLSYKMATRPWSEGVALRWSAA